VKTREIDINEKAKFNDFVASFSTGDLMQSYEWGEIKRKSGGWKPVRLIGEDDNGQVIASALMLFRSIPKTGRTIAYVPRGPVIDTTDLSLLEEFTAAMRDAALKRRAILVKIDPPVPVEDEESAKNIEKSGFMPIPDSTGFGGTQPKCVMQLDIVDDIEQVFENFKPKWRYNIRLAQKKGVAVNTNCTKDDLRRFHDLYKITASRDGFVGRGFSYFETLWDVLEPEGYAKLFLTCYGETTLSGALAFVIGDRAWYVYGASSNEHRNLMPNHLMQWEMIQWAKSLGCKWYDFRGVSPRRGASEEDDHLQGLNRFKEGFSARYVEYIGEYDLILSPVWYWLWVKVKPMALDILKRRARAKSTMSNDM
jgi:lipid II:glycine glycyltransferase (peptidoglycan interpeptide bridge formation enzyme)